MEINKIAEILVIKNQDVKEFIAAIILDEILSSAEVFDLDEILDDPEFMLEVLKIGVEMYFETDYSTPTGIGVVMGEWFDKEFQIGKTYSYQDLKEAIRNFYFLNDWR